MIRNVKYEAIAKTGKIKREIAAPLLITVPSNPT
jgi:hypothetical protein